MLIKNLKRELKFNGNTGIILGSGLGHLADELKDKISVSYNNIKSFPISTVSGHNSEFVSGFYNDTQLLLARG